MLADESDGPNPLRQVQMKNYNGLEPVQRRTPSGQLKTMVVARKESTDQLHAKEAMDRHK